jgi:hypothetical protein
MLLGAEAQASSDKQLYVSVGLKPSKGISGYLTAYAYSGTTEGKLYLSKGSRTSATYTGHTKLSSKKVKVSLGALGSFSMRFKATKKPEKQHVKGCQGVSVTTQGQFHGKAQFRGEGGFTKIDQKTATGYVMVSNFHDCKGGGGGGGTQPPGKPQIWLTACSGGVESVQLTAVKPEQGGSRAAFTVQEKGASGSVGVERYVTLKTPLAAFKTAPDLSSATLTPGGPFSGTGSYASGELSGDLRVELLGGGTVPLSSTEASLQVPSTPGMLPGCISS